MTLTRLFWLLIVAIGSTRVVVESLRVEVNPALIQTHDEMSAERMGKFLHSMSNLSELVQLLNPVNLHHPYAFLHYYNTHGCDSMKTLSHQRVTRILSETTEREARILLNSKCLAVWPGLWTLSSDRVLALLRRLSTESPLIHPHLLVRSGLYHMDRNREQWAAVLDHAQETALALGLDHSDHLTELCRISARPVPQLNMLRHYRLMSVLTASLAAQHLMGAGEDTAAITQTQELFAVTTDGTSQPTDRTSQPTDGTSLPVALSPQDCFRMALSVTMYMLDMCNCASPVLQSTKVMVSDHLSWIYSQCRDATSPFCRFLSETELGAVISAALNRQPVDNHPVLRMWGEISKLTERDCRAVVGSSARKDERVTVESLEGTDSLHVKLPAQSSDSKHDKSKTRAPPSPDFFVNASALTYDLVEFYEWIAANSELLNINRDNLKYLCYVVVVSLSCNRASDPDSKLRFMLEYARVSLDEQPLRQFLRANYSLRHPSPQLTCALKAYSMGKNKNAHIALLDAIDPAVRLMLFKRSAARCRDSDAGNMLSPQQKDILLFYDDSQPRNQAILEAVYDSLLGRMVLVSPLRVEFHDDASISPSGHPPSLSAVLQRFWELLGAEDMCLFASHASDSLDDSSHQTRTPTFWIHPSIWLVIGRLLTVCIINDIKLPSWRLPRRLFNVIFSLRFALASEHQAEPFIGFFPYEAGKRAFQKDMQAGREGMQDELFPLIEDILYPYPTSPLSSSMVDPSRLRGFRLLHSILTSLSLTRCSPDPEGDEREIASPMLDASLLLEEHVYLFMGRHYVRGDLQTDEQLRMLNARRPSADRFVEFHRLVDDISWNQRDFEMAGREVVRHGLHALWLGLQPTLRYLTADEAYARLFVVD